MVDSPALTQAVNFERMLDGFTVDGIRYFDPEGEIASFTANNLTGEVTYFVKTSGATSKTFVIKHMKSRSNMAPIVLAQGSARDGLILETSTGKKITGEEGFNTSKGFVIIRKETGFLYTIGKGLTSFAAPAGFHIAREQNGDLESTRFVLLEKNRTASSHKSNPLLGLIETTSELGSMFGVNDKKDYALMNIDSGNLIKLNISYDKTAAHNSIFKRDGSRNLSHYFWRLRWFKGSNGTYALYQPNTPKKKALELLSGKEITLFDSVIGSVGWNYKYVNGNRLKITEVKQFGTGNAQVINDFEAFFTASKANN